VHHQQELVRVVDDVIGQRRDIPLGARRRPLQHVGMDMVEEIAGLVERSGQHTDRVHSPDYMPGHRRSLETIAGNGEQLG
jgi:hypothetical protein